MSVERRYLKNRNFVLTVLRNDLDDDQLIQHVEGLTREAADMAAILELADCTGVTDVSALTAGGIMAAARQEDERPPHLRGKLAILVSTQLVYGLARVYQAVSERYRAAVSVFWERGAALEWLGVADAAAEIEALRQDAEPSDE